MKRKEFNDLMNEVMRQVESQYLRIHFSEFSETSNCVHLHASPNYAFDAIYKAQFLLWVEVMC